MDRQKWFKILYLLVSAVIFFSGPALPSAVADVSSVPSEEEVKRLFEGYTARYVEKDIEGFMAFFSREAIENRMIPYAESEKLYDAAGGRAKIWLIENAGHIEGISDAQYPKRLKDFFSAPD